ncbi:hypothetical protein GCM10025787_50360 [Saccharopolyspora rosea]
MLLGFRTPQALREIGRSRLVSWMQIHNIAQASKVADAALAAAESQHTSLVGEECAAEIVKSGRSWSSTMNSTSWTGSSSRNSASTTSMPGFGQRLGAEFIAATGGDVAALGSADRLAAFAGLAPAPRDSGGSAAISAVRSGSTDAC